MNREGGGLVNIAGAFDRSYGYDGAGYGDHMPLASPPLHPIPEHTPGEVEMTGANNSAPPSRERDLGDGQEYIPLVPHSEIDDFSRGYNDAIGARLGLGLMNSNERDATHYSNIPNTAVNPLRSNPSIHNLRTQDQNRGQEGMRDGGWSPQQLRMNNSSNFAGGNRDGEEEIDIPPRSPLRDSMRGIATNIAAATAAAAAGVGGWMGGNEGGRRVGSGEAPLLGGEEEERERERERLVEREERERDTRPRYQLVDDGVPDDAPVLHSPGQLRGLNHQRGQRSVGKDGM
jgi:hypothetical protein